MYLEKEGIVAYMKEYNRCDGGSEYPDNVLKELGFSEYRNQYRVKFALNKLIKSGILNRKRYDIYKEFYIRGYNEEFIAAIHGKSIRGIRQELTKIRHILKKNRIALLPGVKDVFEDWIFRNELEETVYEDPAEDLSIDELGLSAHSYDALRRVGINTIGDIETGEIERLMKARNLGTRSLNEVIDLLHKRFGIKMCISQKEEKS